MKNQVSILGTIYRIEQRNSKNDKELDGLSGYCNPHTKLIVIRTDYEFEPDISMLREVLRHEIVHAFFYESGLWDSSDSTSAWATNEEMVDWIAIQGLKLYKAREEAEAV